MYSPGLNDLDAVLAVARRSSFRGAALDLGMSTTALSSAIAKLEAHLGVRLFNRTTRSVSLTDAGRAFVEQVAPVLEDIRGAMDAARSQQSKPSGMLRINTFATAAREILEEDDEAEEDDPEGFDDEDEEGPDFLRVRLEPLAVRTFVAQALRLIGAGRPPCPLCGQPLDPQGHLCPRRNGHGPLLN